MEKNKTGKYLKYAIGEIILVVIGILIALSINNWNIKRLNKILETEYIERLKKDLIEEDAVLQATFNYYNQVINHAKNAIGIFENENEVIESPKRFLIDLYQASQIIDPNTTMATYNELIFTGRINIIHNNDLKTYLIRYYEVNWSETDVFKFPNPFRENIRGKIPDIIQSKIRSNCGDIRIKLVNTTEQSLPEKCEIIISSDLANLVANELRQDIVLKNNLRVLIGNLEGKLDLIEGAKIRVQNLLELFEL